MNKKFSLHPLLFAAYFVIAQFASNIGEFNPLHAIRPLVFLLLFVSFTQLILKRIIQDLEYVGFLTTIFVFLLFYYGQIFVALRPSLYARFGLRSQWIVFIAWFITLIFIGSPWVWRRIRSGGIVTKFLNAFAIIAIVFPMVYSLLPSNRVNLRTKFDTMTSEFVHENYVTESLPDVYYIIVDGYGRSDILEEIFQYDNSVFLKFLVDTGFFVAERATSNYMQTAQSLSSSLNYQYIDEQIHPEIAGGSRTLFWTLIQHSRIRTDLEAMGYKTIAFATGYEPTEWIDADIYISPFNQNVSRFEGLLLSSSILTLISEQVDLGIYLPTYKSHRELIRNFFDQIIRVPELHSPKLVFAHILAPHPPFVFDQYGSDLLPIYPYTIWDANEYPGELEEYRDGYTGEIEYLNSLLMGAINTILNKSPDPPIIILQGDHGSGVFTDLSSVANTCLRERFSILNAYYFPNADYESLYHSITPVNTFRIVLNSIFETEIPLLEDQRYYSIMFSPFEYIDVTSEVESACRMP